MTERLTTYLMRGNRRVDGWLADGAMQIICRINQAQIDADVQGHFAEIGIHHGRLFILLALLARPQEMGIAIDLFEQQHLNPEQSGRGNLTQFMKNLSRYADADAVIVHKGDSTQINGQTIIDKVGGPIRLFSVDGGHTADITHHDLETAETSLAQGGVIILDDCFAEEWPDVSTGFHRFFAKPRRLVPFATGCNKTFLTTPDAASRYKDAIAGCGTAVTARNFMRHSVLCVRYGPRPFHERFRDLRAWSAIRGKPGIPTLRNVYHNIRRML
jgi:hypothetical protein